MYPMPTINISSMLLNSKGTSTFSFKSSVFSPCMWNKLKGNENTEYRKDTSYSFFINQSKMVT